MTQKKGSTTRRTLREKTIRVKGTGSGTMATKAWGRGGRLVFVSPSSRAQWGGGFAIHLSMDHPELGLFVRPAEARRLAAELIRRADDRRGRDVEP